MKQHREKVISGLGGFIGILSILLFTSVFVDVGQSPMIVASMGASAVLLFAVPHGPLSQPWSISCGHLVSAVIGMLCLSVFSNSYIAAASAVGLSIVAMYSFRCIHPPGGATALTIVLSQTGLHSFDYQYLLTPVLSNILILLGMAIIFNYAFPWRRYPLILNRSQSLPSNPALKPLATKSWDNNYYKIHDNVQHARFVNDWRKNTPFYAVPSHLTEIDDSQVIKEPT